MATFEIMLCDEDRRFIEEAVHAGRYASESEALADAIAVLRAREQQHQAHLDGLRAKVIAGLDQLDRGEGREWNVEEVMAKGRAMLAARAATPA